MKQHDDSRPNPAQAEQTQTTGRRIKPILLAAAAVIVVAALVVVTRVILPAQKYQSAVAQMEAGQYDEAIATFEALEGYRDSEEQIARCREALEDAQMEASYKEGVAHMREKRYEKAIAIFSELGAYQDSQSLLAQCREIVNAQEQAQHYREGLALMEQGEYEKALAAFRSAQGYEDSAAKILACEESILGLQYQAAEALLADGDLYGAATAFAELNYADSAARSMAIWNELSPGSNFDAGWQYSIARTTDGAVYQYGLPAPGWTGCRYYNDV